VTEINGEMESGKSTAGLVFSSNTVLNLNFDQMVMTVFGGIMKSGKSMCIFSIDIYIPFE
jgi:hypothetical protein